MITRYEAKCKYIQLWTAFSFQPSTITVIRKNSPNTVIVCVCTRSQLVAFIYIYYIIAIMSSGLHFISYILHDARIAVSGVQPSPTLSNVLLASQSENSECSWLFQILRASRTKEGIIIYIC